MSTAHLVTSAMILMSPYMLDPLLSGRFMSLGARKNFIDYNGK